MLTHILAALPVLHQQLLPRNYGCSYVCAMLKIAGWQATDSAADADIGYENKNVFVLQ